MMQAMQLESNFMVGSLIIRLWLRQALLAPTGRFFLADKTNLLINKNLPIYPFFEPKLNIMKGSCNEHGMPPQYKFIVHLTIVFMNYIPKQNPHLSSCFIPNRTFLSVKRLKPTPYVQHQQSPPLHLRNQEENICLPAVERGKQLSLIIFKHRRQEYAGYKQSLHNNKSVKSGQDCKELNLLEPPRKYEINFRNVDKLRKRYSLDPPHSVRRNDPNESIFINSIKSLQRLNLSTYAQQSETATRIGVRSKLKKATQRKCSQSSKTILCHQNNIQLIAARSKNASGFQRERQAVPSIIIAGETELQKKQSCNKVADVKNPFKKKFQNKVGRFKRHKIESSFRLLVNLKTEEDASVSGWSNQSFYEKVKPRFFQQLCMER